jgi:hypothetical protein
MDRQLVLSTVSNARRVLLSIKEASQHLGHPSPRVRFMVSQIVYTGIMSTKDTTTVRLRRSDSERLKAFAARNELTVVEVAHSAIDALERQEFLAGLSADYQRLKNNPELYEQLLAERREWDPLA